MATKKTRYETKIMCKVCQCETWHNVLNKAFSGYNDEESGIWEENTFYTLQCLGCDNVCLLNQYIFSENTNPETGNPDVQKFIYPSPYKGDREPIDRIYDAPKNVSLVYGETIKAFNSGLMILAGIGVRSIIETISIEQKIVVWGIETKIKEMVKQNIITVEGAKLLRLVKDIGNITAHEIKKQHHDDLALCIDIVEGVIRTLYILPKEAEHTRKIIDGKWTRC
jgi:hypothetical protein